LEGLETIGQTRIDLEDRYYSNCYATCGLPTKFEIKGYNAWRDVLLPKQILAKFCKKFSLQIPMYVSKKIMIYDAKGNLVYSNGIRHGEDDENNLQITSESSTNFEEMEERSMDSVDSDIDIDDQSKNSRQKQTKQKINVIEEQLALDALNNFKWKEKFGASFTFCLRLAKN
jgi:hypothetical protein